MNIEIWCLLTTVETQEQARKLAHEAVDRRLAACVQIEASITSVYKWKDTVEAAPESRLIFKFPAEKKNALTEWLRAHHPYEVPEILAWPVAEADPEYADWVATS